MQFLMRFWKHFGFPFGAKNGAFLEVILNSCLDSAENGAPHENTLNSNEIEIRALGKATNTPPTTEEKTLRKENANQTHFLMLLGLILGGF